MDDFYKKVLLFSMIIFYCVITVLVVFGSIQLQSIAHSLSNEKRAEIYEEINESYMKAQADADQLGVERMAALKGTRLFDTDKYCYNGYVYYKNGAIYLVNHENEKPWKPVNPVQCYNDTVQTPTY